MWTFHESLDDEYANLQKGGAGFVFFGAEPTAEQGAAMANALNSLEAVNGTPAISSVCDIYNDFGDKSAFGTWVKLEDYRRLAARFADSQSQIGRLQEALALLETDAHFIFNNPPSESPQIARDVIEWFSGSIRKTLKK